MKFLFLFFLLFLVRPMSAEVLTSEEIARKIEAADKLPDSEEKREIIGLWEEALTVTKATEDARVKTKEHQERTVKLGGLTTLTIPEPPAPDAPLAEHTAFQEALNATIETAKARKGELGTEESVSASRSLVLGELIAKAKAELSEVVTDEVPVGAVGQVENQRTQQRKAYYEAELAKIQAEQDLIRKRSETVSDRIARRDEQIAKLREMLADTTRTVSTLRAKQTQSTRDSLDGFEQKFAAVPELKRVVGEIRELNERRSAEKGVDAKLTAAASYLEDVRKKKERIYEQAKSTRLRIKLLEEAGLGVDSETGLRLRTQRSKLPAISELENELRENGANAAQAQIYEAELRERLDTPAVPAAELAKILTENPAITREDVDALLEKRRTLLKALRTDYQTLSASLREGTTTAKLTILEIKGYSEYLDQRLLWIKSTRPLSTSEPLEEWLRVVGLFRPGMIGEAWQSAREHWLSNILTCGLLLVLILYALIRRRTLLQRIETSCAEAARRNCTTIVPTWKTIMASVILASALPALVFIFVSLFEEVGPYADGLTNMAVLLFVGRVLMRFSRKQGLFVSHFKVDPEKSRTVYRNLTWFIPAVAPFAFLIGALIETDTDQSAGRLVFMAAMVLLGIFAHRVLRFPRSILREGEEVTTLVRGAYFLGIGIPLVFIIGAALGYFASVLTLRAQVMATLGLVVLAFLLIRFFTRWILVSRRKLAIDQALRRREAALAERAREKEKAKKKDKGEAPSETEAELPSLEEVKAQAVNLVEVEVQTTQLLRLSVYFAAFFAIWGVWSSTLPALKFLDEVTILEDESAPAAKAETSTPVIPGLTPSEEKPKEEGAPAESSTTAADRAPSGGESLVDKIPAIAKPHDNRVSLQDLFLSILIAVVTFVAARNIPGLLSLTVFNRIKLGPGGNFALTTTARYLIVLIGVVMALGMIGITWGKVQWLAAAITLGIGFGLQEIFANFVAGIIMLFERPVRLGDIVTVGDVSGKVTQINIRATTIQQFNNRELLVPNKEFITSQLVNWTLRDTVLRFEILVGIAYGSDTRKATGILKEILEKHPKILNEPKPDVLFSAFGASTLDFTLRAFVGFVEDLIVTQSEVHYLIDDAFREGGIEIAFPQQDIHLRSLPERLEKQILPAES